jgi:hypothetical protein
MVRFVHEDRVLAIASGAALTGRETALLIGGGLARVGISYIRPTRVGSGEGEQIPITDHVMAARLVALGAVLMAVLWRWLRD